LIGVTARRPAIGILTPFTPASWSVWSMDAALLPGLYVAAVNAAGGLALLVAPDPALTEDPDELLDRIDGLMLTGGTDVDPGIYGEEPHPETQAFQRDRDEFEVALALRAIERDMPVLGICRGMQVLNVAHGGTLLQHLPESHGHEDHRRVPGSFDGADHAVRLLADSLAARAAGELLHATKSHHHQGVGRIGRPLLVSGVSVLDELPEALERPDRTFVLGVQWHPEADPRSPVIASLVRAAAEFRARRELGAAATAGVD
jgi:putative glutamine amidotransferase